MFCCPPQNCTVAQYFSQPFPKPGRNVFTLLCTMPNKFLSKRLNECRAGRNRATFQGKCDFILLLKTCDWCDLLGLFLIVLDTSIMWSKKWQCSTWFRNYPTFLPHCFFATCCLGIPAPQTRFGRLDCKNKRYSSNQMRWHEMLNLTPFLEYLKWALNYQWSWGTVLLSDPTSIMIPDSHCAWFAIVTLKIRQ